MMPGVQVFEALPGHVGVNLRRGQVAVSQKHLHHAKVGPVVEQMRGEGMA